MQNRTYKFSIKLQLRKINKNKKEFNKLKRNLHNQILILISVLIVNRILRLRLNKIFVL